MQSPQRRFLPGHDEPARQVDGLRASVPAQPLNRVSGDNHGKRNRVVTRQLRLMIDAIPGAVIVLDARGRVDDFNQTAAELLGEPLGGEPWREIVPRVFLQALDQGELRTADGRQYSISTRPLGYQPGQILLLSEVTQTRALQRAAQQNLHLMTMGKMMASLAHQIRTPLSSAMLYLSQVAEGGLDEVKSLRFSSKALDRIRHIEKTINDMLVFAHGGQFLMSELSVDDLLQELQDQLRPQFELHHARVDIRRIEPAPRINGNKDALLGALANLCMNAIDAGGQGLHLRIDVSLNQRGDLLLAIADNASGMDQHTLDHLFDPFFTTKESGTGLGLAVVRSVIESHQGQISVESAPGAGSRFSLLLPTVGSSKTQLSHSEAGE